MGRPRKFSREALQDAALALVDEHGLEGLTMRALAARVGSGAMTLYNHVQGRADLEMLVVEAVVAETEWSHERFDDWRDQLRDVATAMWRTLRVHPHAIPLIMVRRTRSRRALAVAEAMLAALARSGRTGQDLLIAFRAVQAFVMGFAQAELAGPLTVAAGEPAAEAIARVQALPRADFARLIEIAGAARSSTAEAEFRGGLDLLLDGLDARPRQN